MKILLGNLSGLGGPSIQRHALGKVFRHIGWDVIDWNWDRRAKPIYDVAYENPDVDIFIGSAYGDCLTRDVKGFIKSRPTMKTILYAKTYGPVNDEPDFKDYVVDAPNTDDFRNVDEVAPYIEGLYIHHHENRLNYTLGYWRDRVKGIYSIPKGMDAIGYAGGAPQDFLKCDVGYIGSWWAYKGINLDKYVKPLCHPSVGLNVKIFGGGGWNVANYLGALPDNLLSSFVLSCTISLSCSEPHSNRYGADVVERNLKVPGIGGFLISDHVASLTEDYFPNGEVVTASDPDDYREKVFHFLKNPDERIPYMEKGQRAVLRSMTYFDRVSTLLSQLGWIAESEKCLNAKAKFLKENYNFVG
jgi:hypothetical protein